VDEEDHVHGFALLRSLDGTSVTGPITQVWQVYAWPGRSKLLDLYRLAWPTIVEWAQAHNSSRLMMYTRRHSPAYRRLLKAIGFTPHMVVYQASI